VPAGAAAGSPSPNAGHEPRVGDVAGWLRQLGGRGVSRIWLALPEPEPITGPFVSADEYELAGFANAGRGGLRAKGRLQAEARQATWTVGDREAPGRRIWSVRYRGRYARHAIPARPAPGEARDHLTGALRAARDLAVRQGLAAMAASGSSDLAGGSTYYAGKNSQGQKLLFTVDHTASGPKFDPIFINQIARCPATGDGPR